MRILSQEEHEGLLQGYRAVVMTDLVPLAVKAVRHHLKKKDRQAGIETLYGAKVLLQQHDIAVTSQAAERDYSSAMVRFYYEYGRWPTKAEAIEFDKTIPVEPLVKKVH